MVGNGQLETPIATTQMPLEVRVTTFVVRFAVMVNLANPLIGLSLLRRNGTLLDMGERTLKFQSVFMQFKDANNSYQKITEPLFNPHEIILQPGKQTMVCVESQIYREHEVTQTLQPTQFIKNNDEFFICPAIMSCRNHHYIVQINNSRSLLYTQNSNSRKKFSILTPQQMN